MEILKENANMAEIQQYVKDVCIEKWWDKNDIFSIFLLFTEEVWELAKAIRYANNLHVEEHKKKSIDLEWEFADVFAYLVDLANNMWVDLEKALRNKMAEIDKREWK